MTLIRSLMVALKRSGLVVSVLLLPVLLLIVAMVASPGRAAENPVAQHTLTIAGMNVAVWTPPKTIPGPWPVILFSHGFHGCNTQSTFLTQGLAENGYAVFAPNHRDASCGNLRVLLQGPVEPFAKPDEWTDATYADRRQDIENLIDALKADPIFGAPAFDWNELGLVGHSLGGYTVLGLSGAWPSWKDSRAKAVVGLSPYSTPFLQRGDLGDLGVPAMYQGGTLDITITPFVAKADGVYDQTRPPKYYVEFQGAGHMAWTDLRAAATYHGAIIEYTLAFLDHALKGKPFPEALAAPHGVVSAVRIAE
jgi:predicted dienelactone hydrolase